MIHFDAHADTGDVTFGSLVGHGQPMRRLIESGAVRGDRFLQIGLRGYWPGPETLAWMAAQGMRSYEMTEIVARGLDECLTEAFATGTDDCDGVFLSVDIDVCDPGHAPGTGTPEPGGLTARQLLDAVRPIAYELPVVGVDVVEVSPPYDHATSPRRWRTGWSWRCCRGWRAAAATRSRGAPGSRASRCSTAADRFAEILAVWRRRAPSVGTPTGLAFQGEGTVRTARATIMDAPTSQHHDGTPRHGTGAHSLWKGVLAPGLKSGTPGAMHCYKRAGHGSRRGRVHDCIRSQALLLTRFGE